MYKVTDLTPLSIWLHTKTQSYYVALGFSTCSTNGEEGKMVVVYYSQTYQQLKHRDAAEFLDGRFVKITN